MSINGIHRGMPHFTDDGRDHISELYERLAHLSPDKGWDTRVLHEPTVGDISLPVMAISTSIRGPALWLIAGIHGEEPAGPIAVSHQINFMNYLASRGMPIVVLPNCNPAGYVRDYRYTDVRRGDGVTIGTSAGDSEHLLPHLINPLLPRIASPASAHCAAVTRYVVARQATHPPRIVIDLHEDEFLDGVDWFPESYIYSQGVRGKNCPAARRAVDVLHRSGMDMKFGGRTRFGQIISNGIVSNPHDGSIDELLASSNIIVDGRHQKSPRAKSVVVVETPTHIELPNRVAAHENVIRAIPELFNL